jgi:hypothetical protein
LGLTGDGIITPTVITTFTEGVVKDADDCSPHCSHGPCRPWTCANDCSNNSKKKEASPLRTQLLGLQSKNKAKELTFLVPVFAFLLLSPVDTISALAILGHVAEAGKYAVVGITVLILVGLTAVWFFVFHPLLPLFVSWLPGQLFLLIFHIHAALAIISYYRCVFLAPGFVPVGWVCYLCFKPKITVFF